VPVATAVDGVVSGGASLLARTRSLALLLAQRSALLRLQLLLLAFS
jgi:hypothetical protein